MRSAVNSGNRITTDGLIFYLDVTNQKSYISGSTTTTDLISNIDGTLVNGVGYDSDNLGSFVFDGVDDYLKMDINSIFDLDGTDSYSISGWIKKTGATYFPILQKLFYPNVSTQDGYRVYIHPTLNVVTVNLFGAGTSAILVQTTNTISINTWLNITVTYDGSQTAAGVNIYINGILQTLIIGSDTYTGTMVNSENVTLGGQPTPTNPLYATGNISNVSLYNKVLSQSKITQNYNALKYRFI